MRTGATGVDYVKVGLLPGTQLENCIKALAPAATQYRLVAVFFADRGVPFEGAASSAHRGLRRRDDRHLRQAQRRVAPTHERPHIADFHPHRA
jgi:hypothetical protein